MPIWWRTPTRTADRWSSVRGTLLPREGPMTLTFDPIDFEEFHTITLPARIAAGNDAPAAADLAGVGTLAFRVPDGAAYTYVPSPDTVEIWDGDAAADTVVNLTREA